MASESSWVEAHPCCHRVLKVSSESIRPNECRNNGSHRRSNRTTTTDCFSLAPWMTKTCAQSQRSLCRRLRLVSPQLPLKWVIIAGSGFDSISRLVSNCFLYLEEHRRKGSTTLCCGQGDGDGSLQGRSQSRTCWDVSPRSVVCDRQSRHQRCVASPVDSGGVDGGARRRRARRRIEV